MILSFIAAYNIFFQIRIKNNKGDTSTNIFEQICLDYIALGAAAYFSGGYDSPLMYYFVLHIGVAGILLPKAWVYRVAILGSALATTVMILSHFGVMPYFPIFRDITRSASGFFALSAYAAIFTSMMFFAAYIISYLSGKAYDKQASLTRMLLLTERLRSTIQIKDVMKILIENIRSIETIRHVKYLFLNKESVSLELAGDSFTEGKLGNTVF